MPIVKTEDRAFVRDTASRALLNTDTASLQKHRAQRAERNQMSRLIKEVAELRGLVVELSTRLDSLLAKE